MCRDFCVRKSEKSLIGFVPGWSSENTNDEGGRPLEGIQRVHFIIGTEVGVGWSQNYSR